jgi:hypothetical protein
MLLPLWVRSPQLRRHTLVFVATAFLVAVAALNAAFSFQGTFQKLSDYQFGSKLFQSLQKIPVLNRMPLPAPRDYLTGLDITKTHEEDGSSFGNIYLLGQLHKTSEGGPVPFRSYYLVAYVFKEPIVFPLLFLAGLVCALRRPDFLKREWFLLVPVFGYFAILSFFDRAQIGVRHLLVAIPLMLIVSAGCFANWSRWSRRARLGTAALLAGTAVSVGSYYPAMIPYFNELVPDKRLAYRVLADSNLDWGQNRDKVRAFLAAHPDVVLNPPAPVTGKVLVSANVLTGVSKIAPDMSWLAGRTPEAHVGYAHLLFAAEDASK